LLVFINSDIEYMDTDNYFSSGIGFFEVSVRVFGIYFRCILLEGNAGSLLSDSLVNVINYEG